MTQEEARIFLKVILVLELASKVNFGPQNWNFQFFEIFNFQFSSITHFLSHKFEDPSCRICSYGPYGPFWFSVKKWFWYVNFHQVSTFWEKVTFWDYCVNELIFWRYVLNCPTGCDALLSGLGCWGAMSGGSSAAAPAGPNAGAPWN